MPYWQAIFAIFGITVGTIAILGLIGIFYWLTE